MIAAAQPYTPPVADSIAIVVGNTQNTPQAKLNDQIEDLIRQTLMRHQGEEAEELADAISIIESDGRPYVVDLDYHKLRSISQNSAQATTDVDYNLKQINQQLSTVVPKASGANYLEAILLARDEVDDDANIVVIGSGLSDTGDLNFVGSNILTDSKAEADVVGRVIDEHQDALRGSDVTLMGLGDTVAPQSSLSSTQREVVRNIYKEVIRGLGGHATIERKSLRGDAVKTPYTVNPTDTGCGDIDLTLDEDKLKFNSDETSFADPSTAERTLSQVVDIYNNNADDIDQVVIEGFIAHYQSRKPNLAQDRADTVRNWLVDHGIPADKITASGKGYGPYEYNDDESHDQTDSRNRMIKVTIRRSEKECRR